MIRFFSTIVIATTTIQIPVAAFVQNFGGIAATRGNRHGSGSDHTIFRSVSSPLPLPLFSDTTGNQEKQNNELLASLQNTLVYIEALELRNKAQLESFVDEEDQWESLEDFERELLSSKEEVMKRLDELSK